VENDLVSDEVIDHGYGFSRASARGTSIQGNICRVGLVGTLAVLMTLLSNGCAPTAQNTANQPSAATPAKNRITIYDAFGKVAGTKQDWGYAALVEVNGKRILFDTGDNPETFAQNVKAKGVSPSRRSASRNSRLRNSKAHADRRRTRCRVRPTPA